MRGSARFFGRRTGLPDRKKLRAPHSSTVSAQTVSLQTAAAQQPHVYWHSELPPAEADPIAEYVVEATSARVPHTLAHRDELWDRCYQDLMAQARIRLEQEIVRLGGSYAHVLEEHLESKTDAVTSESWLAGRFRYVLYGRPGVPKLSGQAT